MQPLEFLEHIHWREIRDMPAFTPLQANSPPTMMTYTQPTLSYQQKMKEKATQSQSVSDLPLQPSSHSANAAHEQVPINPEVKRNSANLSATLQAPHNQPDLWYLAATQAQRRAASKGKGKGTAIESAAVLQEPFKEFNLEFSLGTEYKSTEPSEGKLISPSQHTFFEYPDLQTWSVPENESAANSKRDYQQDNSTQAINVHASSMHSFQPQSPAKKGRYYSHALSDDDKQALTVGEKNHNLQSWSPQDAVNHHESPKELVPRTMNKVDKIEALAGIEYEKQSAQRDALKMAPQVRGWWSKLSGISVSTLANSNEETEYKPTLPHSYLKASHSMIDLQSSSAPTPHLKPMPSPPPFNAAGPSSPTHYSNAHTRATSTSQPFTQSTPSLPLTPPPSSPTASSPPSRGPSPLASQAFHHNPNATFDDFLAPHKSGKGETHYENENAKKPDAATLSLQYSSSTPSGRQRLAVDSPVCSPVVMAMLAPVRRFSWES